MLMRNLKNCFLQVKNPYCCRELRNLAIIDVLNSTGIRVGELVNLDIGDINFEERECVGLGKGYC